MKRLAFGAAIGMSMRIFLEGLSKEGGSEVSGKVRFLDDRMATGEDAAPRVTSELGLCLGVAEAGVCFSVTSLF